MSSLFNFSTANIFNPPFYFLKNTKVVWVSFNQSTIPAPLPKTQLYQTTHRWLTCSLIICVIHKLKLLKLKLSIWNNHMICFSIIVHVSKSIARPLSYLCIFGDLLSTSAMSTNRNCWWHILHHICGRGGVFNLCMLYTELRFYLGVMLLTHTFGPAFKKFLIFYMGYQIWIKLMINQISNIESKCFVSQIKKRKLKCAKTVCVRVSSFSNHSALTFSKTNIARQKGY